MTITMTPGDNLDTVLDVLRKQLKTLGAADGKGSASRPEAGLRLVSAAYDGTIMESDAEEMFASYAAGVSSAAKANPLVTCAGDADQKSAKQQVSKFRQFIKVGMLPSIDAREVMGRAVQISKDLEASGTKTHSRFDAMLNVAREQIKQPDTPLTDDQITSIVAKPETAEKSEIDKLIAAYKAAHKLAETIPLPQTLAAVDAYRDAITEMGGDVPPMTKEEKAEADAMSFLRKRGMVATYAIAAE